MVICGQMISTSRIWLNWKQLTVMIAMDLHQPIQMVRPTVINHEQNLLLRRDIFFRHLKFGLYIWKYVGVSENGVSLFSPNVLLIIRSYWFVSPLISYIWRFSEKLGCPQLSSIYNKISHEINHPVFWGYPHRNGNHLREEAAARRTPMCWRIASDAGNLPRFSHREKNDVFGIHMWGIK